MATMKTTLTMSVMLAMRNVLFVLRMPLSVKSVTLLLVLLKLSFSHPIVLVS